VIDGILPSFVASAETFAHFSNPWLYPEEMRAINQAVTKRRLEFSDGRECARRAMEQMGLPAAPIPRGTRGDPLWPTGVVGSITHCPGYCAAAVALDTTAHSVGIDAEPHAGIPDNVLRFIAIDIERAELRSNSRQRPGICWDRLLFSAKESVFKAWYPLTVRPLAFNDVHVTFEPDIHRFLARLLVSGPTVSCREVTSGAARLTSRGPLTSRGQLAEFVGSWAVRDDLLVTSVVICPDGDTAWVGAGHTPPR
jgi:4'-phosphopantetheinyl transferase EntD